MTCGEHEDIAVADVATVDAGSLPETLTYAVPPYLLGALSRGSPVTVSIRGKPALGYVVRLHMLRPDDPLARKLIPLRPAPSGSLPLSEYDIQLAEWLAQVCVASLGDAIRSVRPPSLQASVERFVQLTELGADDQRLSEEVLRSRARQRVLAVLREHNGRAAYSTLVRTVGPSASEAIASLIVLGLVEEVVEERPGVRHREQAAVELTNQPTADIRLTAAQRRVLDVLSRERGPVAVTALAKTAGVSRAVIENLAKHGLARRSRVIVRRAPIQPCGQRLAAITHTDEQKEAIAAVLAELEKPQADKRPILISGVTASGKTEVYLEAIQATRASGRGAIVLVPEIALAAQVVDVIAQRFGDDVAVLHSRLSNGERFDEWQRVANGEAGIAVGARSAVFAPVRNLGLVVVDEEHETTYKQDAAPRYHARDVALKRAHDNGATVVLGSATPSMESYYEACQGNATLITLEKRATGAALPEVEVLDMRTEFRKGPTMFAGKLVEAIEDRLAKHEQTLLFLNRRGYASFVLCRDCGYVATCPECAVSLTYHASARLLRCHHCGHGEPPPTCCPQCNGTRLRGFGLGTERIQEEVLRLFPKARVLRMDRDTTTHKGAHAQIIRAFRRGDADVLIGTQMVAKGLDFPRVTLVGVVSADVGLHIPDFRAAERSFQLLAQVAGRAGRADIPGQVLIQTFTPEHYAVQCGAQQDYTAFYTREIEQRRLLQYPPFVRLANIVASSGSAETAEAAISAFADAVRAVHDDTVKVTGPAPAPIEKLRGEFRWHVLLRSDKRDQLTGAVHAAMKRVPSGLRHLLAVDMDPVSLA